MLDYIHYRALEQAAQAPTFANRAGYLAADASAQAAWQGALTRASAGVSGMANLTTLRIEQLPELLGFDYFDVDASLVYGASPFVGNLLYSERGAFNATFTARALQARGFSLGVLATGTAWGKGGDGQTDVNALEMGDLFGGDVGLASRVAVLDAHTLGNAFIWGILVQAAEAHDGRRATLADSRMYRTLAAAMSPVDGLLVQATLLNTLAGQQQLEGEGTLPPYLLAGLADTQVGEQSGLRLVLLYGRYTHAKDAAAALPALIAAYDPGWLARLGYTDSPPEVRLVGGYWLLSYTLYADALPQDEAGLVFGFWREALLSRRFTPLAVPAGAQ